MPHSSTRSAGALHLEPRASRLLALWAVFTHTTAAAALWLADLPASLDITLGALILGSYLDVFTRHVMRIRSAAVVRLTCTGRGPWRLVTRGGREYAADLRGDSCVHPWLVLLNFDRRPGGRATVVLTPDSLDSDQLRRLRVLLRTGGIPG